MQYDIGTTNPAMHLLPGHVCIIHRYKGSDKWQSQRKSLPVPNAVQAWSVQRDAADSMAGELKLNALLHISS